MAFLHHLGQVTGVGVQGQLGAKPYLFLLPVVVDLVKQFAVFSRQLDRLFHQGFDFVFLLLDRLHVLLLPLSVVPLCLLDESHFGIDFGNDLF